VPDEFSNGETQLLSTGSNHTCATTEVLLKCFGSNISGVLDIPDNEEKIKEGVDSLSSAANHNCVIKNAKISCWGIINKVSNQFET